MGKRTDWGKEYCICCPVCSKVNLKSNEAKASVICPRCGREYHVILKDDVMLQIMNPKKESFGEIAEQLLQL